MSAWTPPVHGHGRPPVRARWPRRIAGVLATAALFGVALAMALMIRDAVGPSDESTVAPPAAATGTAHAKHAAGAKHGQHGPRLTAAQRKARTAAVSAMRGEGYEPVSLKQYDPRHALRVLIGYRSGDPSGPRRAFFFRSSGLVGTDSTAPSTGLKITGSGSSWATLSYGVYAAGDQTCCPSGGRVKVRFGWTGTEVAPVGGTMPADYQRVSSG
jgi:LppP/LprE lipoprotein